METMRVRVAHKVVAGWHVFTSPDVPELYAANPDRQCAWDAIAPGVAMIRRGQHRPAMRIEVIELEHA